MSRKRSTQFARQLDSEREKLVEGVLVMHLRKRHAFMRGYRESKADMDALVPAHARESLDGSVEPLLGLLVLKERLEFFLGGGAQQVS